MALGCPWGPWGYTTTSHKARSLLKKYYSQRSVDAEGSTVGRMPQHDKLKLLNDFKKGMKVSYILCMIADIFIQDYTLKVIS